MRGGGFGPAITENSTWLGICLRGVPHVGPWERRREKIKKGNACLVWGCLVEQKARSLIYITNECIEGDMMVRY